MKKIVLFSILIIIFLSLNVSFIIAQTNETNDTGEIIIDSSGSSQDQIDNAYSCLENKIDDISCSSLSLEERIFSLLSVRKCKNEVLSESENNNECWPKSDCNVKTTAQAILALEESGSSTDKAELWLLSQNTTPLDVDWFLEIESSEATGCSVTYSENSYNINIDAEKKINSGAGTCLTLSDNRYWLKVSPSCYNEEFRISCDKGFLTTLLFRKKSSQTIHVSEKTSSASAEGTTTEKIDSLCFKSHNGACDYEGSLWAAIVLNSLGHEISPFMPYLVTMAEESGNAKYLPEAFLYLLTSYPDFRNDLLLKQKANKYWSESEDKFYDTALALYPFQYEDLSEKSNSKDWLFEVQDTDGCWKGNIRNTAFVLYSLWPKSYHTDDSGGIDCENAGYYCMSEIRCGGKVLSGYDCSGVFKCCDSPVSSETCSDFGGEICNSEQICVGGRTEDSYDLNYGETCCISGSCQTPSEGSECESYGGVCRIYSCTEGEISKEYGCETQGDTCCVTQTQEPGKNYW